MRESLTAQIDDIAEGGRKSAQLKRFQTSLAKKRGQARALKKEIGALKRDIVGTLNAVQKTSKGNKTDELRELLEFAKSDCARAMAENAAAQEVSRQMEQILAERDAEIQKSQLEAGAQSPAWRGARPWRDFDREREILRKTLLAREEDLRAAAVARARAEDSQAVLQDRLTALATQLGDLEGSAAATDQLRNKAERTVRELLGAQDAVREAEKVLVGRGKVVGDMIDRLSERGVNLLGSSAPGTALAAPSGGDRYATERYLGGAEAPLWDGAGGASEFEAVQLKAELDVAENALSRAKRELEAERDRSREINRELSDAKRELENSVEGSAEARIANQKLKTMQGELVQAAEVAQVSGACPPLPRARGGGPLAEVGAPTFTCPPSPRHLLSRRC